MARKNEENEIAVSIKYFADKLVPKKKTIDLRGFADHLMTWANLVFATLVLGQVFSDKFNFQFTSLGFATFIVIYAIAFWIYLKKGGDSK